MNDKNYGSESMADYEEEISWDEVGVPPGLGKHNFLVDKVEYKLNSSGKHMVKLQAKIEAAVDPNNEKFIGRTVFTNFNFTQQGGFVVKNFANALGIELPRTVNKAVLEDWMNSHVLGQLFGATIQHRDFQNQKQADLVQFAPPFDIGGDPIDTSGVEDPPEEEEEPATEGEEEEEAEDIEPADEPEPAPTPTRSIKEAAASSAKKTNGHANGTGTPPPAKKTAKGAKEARR
jgi:hypothetical protein